MPNRISSDELGNLPLDELGRSVRFRRVGQIAPNGDGTVCEATLEDVTPCVIYAEVVAGRVMKFGTTDSVVARQRRNVKTINDVLKAQDGLSLSRNRKITDSTTYDNYKRQAPMAIRAHLKR